MADLITFPGAVVPDDGRPVEHLCNDLPEAPGFTTDDEFVPGLPAPPPVVVLFRFKLKFRAAAAALAADTEGDFSSTGSI